MKDWRKAKIGDKVVLVNDSYGIKTGEIGLITRIDSGDLGYRDRGYMHIVAEFDGHCSLWFYDDDLELLRDYLPGKTIKVKKNNIHCPEGLHRVIDVSSDRDIIIDTGHMIVSDDLSFIEIVEEKDVPKFKVGDKVVVNGFHRYDGVGWKDGDILEIVEVDNSYPSQVYRVKNVRIDDVSRWPLNIHEYITPYQPSKKVAKIVTEKVWRGNTKCRKIVKFENVMTEEELPGKYLNGSPMFYVHDGRGSCFEVNDEGKQCWNLSREDRQRIVDNFDTTDIDTNKYGFILSQGDVWTEENFQKIVVQLKKAGERLADIRRREKKAKEEERKKKEWSGTEEIEI